MARCADVPGMEKESVMVPCAASAAPPSPASAISQIASTAQRLRAAKRPMRYSKRAMTTFFW